jgi:uncharacterized membrane protein YdjX (TVP38/TMEM64 family)
MPELIVPALALIGLAIAALLYFLLVRRRGHDRRRQRADAWDRETSQARSIERLRRLEERDRRGRG